MLGSAHEPESVPVFSNMSVALTKDFTLPINLFKGLGKFYS